MRQLSAKEIGAALAYSHFVFSRIQIDLFIISVCVCVWKGINEDGI